MKALKRIPTWGWVTGGIVVALIGLYVYEQRSQPVLDPCDPENPEYDASKCPPPDESQYPPQTYGMPSGAAGGTQYYLPFPGSGLQTAQGAQDGQTEETTEELPPEKSGPVETEPPGSESIAPVSPVIGVGPGQPVPGSTPSEGLFGAIALPPVQSTPPGQPVPGSTKNEGLFGAITAPTPAPVHQAPPVPSPGGGHESVGQAQPAPSGWCGHPNAVPTGNPCVNGGVGGHSAPAGYHLFCCNGMIGRAPNS